MATYVDDCELDAQKKHRPMIWNIIRVMFASKDPETVQKFLGCIFSPPKAMTLADGRYGVVSCITQSEY
eukprot:6622303-Pyramimonas_sp.AAC.1